MVEPFRSVACNEWRAVGVRACGSETRSHLEWVDGICARQIRPSPRWGARHAGLQPALGDCKEPSGFARGEGFVKTEHPAVAAVARRTVDREGGAKASAVGRMCRGRNDVLAHGNSGL